MDSLCGCVLFVRLLLDVVEGEYEGGVVVVMGVVVRF